MDREEESSHSQCSHTFLALVVLIGLETGISSGASKNLVREVTLVVPFVVRLHLAVSLLRFIYKRTPVSHRMLCG